MTHDPHSIKRLRSLLESESTASQELLRNVQDNSICSIAYDAGIPCLCLTWKDYATSTQLRFIHENIIWLLTEHRVSKALADDTALLSIHADDQSWIANDWMPRAIAAGLRTVAAVRPRAHFGRVSVESIHAIAPKGVTTRSFETLAEARAWLKGVETA